MQNKKETTPISNEPQSTRKLSPWRVLLAIFLVGFVVYSSQLGFRKWADAQPTTSVDPWFAPYVDVTSTPRYAFEQLGTSNVKNVVLAFIVSSPSDACTPTWGGYYTFDDASRELDLDRRIARYRQQEGNVVISFGGLLNDELAINCTDQNQLINAYRSVIDRYQIDTIDLDLEGDSLTNKDSLDRLSYTISNLQKERRDQGKPLAVWLTLPVAPYGLTQDGTDAIAKMLVAGVDLAGINVMTMDYGESKPEMESMQQASQDALVNTHRQLGVLYSNAGITLNSASLWKKLGATPMIGQNDIANEVFTLGDAEGFNEYANANGVARMSMWSANRDIECGENYVNLNIVSDSCSGVKQDKNAYSDRLSRNFDGKITYNASIETENDEVEVIEEDKPEESPYQIWTEKGTYLQGTKVVWHKNVYQAKWWTQGDIPDNPVLQSWETPWQLVGPVLPGEKPIAVPTLPAGTYPEWDGTKIYLKDARVLFEGSPYQAKWWNQGDSPAASSSNPDSSPWVMLTQQQVEAIAKELGQ